MSIGKKLYAGFGIILVIVMLGSAWNHHELGKIEDSYKEMLDTNVSQTMLAQAAKSEIALAGSEVRSYLLEGSEEQLEQFKAHFDELETTFDKFQSMRLDPETAAFVEEIHQVNAEFKSAADKVLDLKRAGDTRNAMKVLEEEMQPMNKQIRDSFDAMIEYQYGQLDKHSSLTEQTAKSAKLGLIIASTLTLLLSTLISVYITRLIRNPIQRLNEEALVIASGDLTGSDITVKNRDEIRSLAESFNRMKENLRQLIGNVHDNSLHLTASAEELTASTNEVSDSSVEIASAVESISNGAQVSAASARESSIAMEETATGVQRVAESASNLRDRANDAMELGGKSESAVHTAKEQMSLIHTSSLQTNELIARLSRQSAEIENIIKVISNITEQTNLLALNAAIEAARAGEHGKGFAVVADEVRKLAEESNHSASQIASLIHAIQQDTKDVENAVGNSLENADRGVQVIDEAGQSFLEIVQAVELMNREIEEISAATEQISASAEEVSASVTDISANADSASVQTEQTAASMEEQMATIQEINAVSNDLSQKAIDLQEMIHQFKI